MTFQIPTHLEPTIRDAVAGGRFASIDEAMAEAVRLLDRELKRYPVTTKPSAQQREAAEPIDPLAGIWHDYADEMDELVAEAHRRREAATWQATAVE